MAATHHSPSGTAGEAPLLPRVAQGDQSAVQALMDRYSGLVWSLARRLASSDPDAEDAVHEIFVDLWRSAARFDASVASEVTFVAMIARRRLIDRRRRMARQPRMEVIQDDSGAASHESHGQDTQAMGEEARVAAKAMGELAPEQQRVLRLSIFHGLSHERIAVATGLPLGTVKTHARRGLIRLRESLEALRSKALGGVRKA